MTIIIMPGASSAVRTRRACVGVNERVTVLSPPPIAWNTNEREEVPYVTAHTTTPILYTPRVAIILKY